MRLLDEMLEIETPNIPADSISVDSQAETSTFMSMLKWSKESEVKLKYSL